MSHRYKIFNPHGVYFVTLTVIHWIDFFTRDTYRQKFIESVHYCQKNKGLLVYAWVIMTNHVHMIVGSDGSNPLEYTLRDLKAYTSRQFRLYLESDPKEESRKEWLLRMMYFAGRKNSNNKDFQFWQQGSHPLFLNTQGSINNCLEYLHLNPVTAGFVNEPEYWLWSSAKDFAGQEGLLELAYF